MCVLQQDVHKQGEQAKTQGNVSQGQCKPHHRKGEKRVCLHIVRKKLLQPMHLDQPHEGL